MSLLSVDGASVRHGLLQAVRDVSFELDEGETLGLIGANGAGKTSLLRAIAGANSLATGRVLFDGHDITRVPAHQRVRQGIALVPEGRRLFADLTVRENLVLARDITRPGPWTIDAVVDAFPLLSDLLGRRAGNLSGGQQQAVAIGRGLLANPRVLLLDEISLGLAPVAVAAVYESLAQVLGTGTTAVVLVEQDVGRALEVCDRVVCMLEGRIVLAAQTADVSREDVIDAYFGLNRHATQVQT
jgi:branched-chain amino acid transport system ATP-binding protein